jgi:hypothetical protein
MKTMAKDTMTQTSFLSRLTVVNEKRGAVILDPRLRARANLLKGITEQFQYLAAEAKGETFVPTRTVYVDDANGQRVQATAAKRCRPWYWFTEGTWFTSVVYGASPIKFGGGTALKCGPQLEDIVATLKLVSEAVSAGELDEELARASAGRGRKAPATTPAAPAKRAATRTAAA